MLMDSSKLQRNLPFTFASLNDIDIIITEKELPRDVMDQCKAANVKVIIADSE